MVGDVRGTGGGGIRLAWPLDRESCAAATATATAAAAATATATAAGGAVVRWGGHPVLAGLVRWAYLLRVLCDGGRALDGRRQAGDTTRTLVEYRE